ncbi:MAG: hypothetical protein HXY34_01590 [Candidatus Thorarchaeota archaeon]|nr:hypothetical protein [Candidatus Thorarchaeota archaeon]
MAEGLRRPCVYSAAATFGIVFPKHKSEYIEDRIGFGGIDMKKRYAALILLVVFVHLAILVTTLHWYWATHEEWLIPIIVSWFCWTTSSLLVGCWTWYVVFPYLNTVVGCTTVKTGRPLHIPRERSAGWRWGFGVGIPLVAVFLGILALLYYPRGWTSSLFIVAWVVLLLSVLRRHRFFAEPSSSEATTQEAA